MDRELLKFVGSGVAAVAIAIWAVFTYFDTRRRRPATDGTGITPEQLVQIVSLLKDLRGDVTPPVQMQQRGLDQITLGKFLSRVLRHDPRAAFISMDEYGWAQVEPLIAGINAAGYQVTRLELDQVVQNSRGERQEARFSFSPDRSRIRANWGHSVPVRSPF